MEAADAEKLDELERRFWAEVTEAAGEEAREEDGYETRQYGPVQATVVAASPLTPLLNIVLGAASPGALGRGSLTEALDWTETLGLDCRVPVHPDPGGEAEAVEALLGRRGYRPAASLTRFVRDASPPAFPEPPVIEIDEWADTKAEGFSDHFAEGYGLDRVADWVFSCLPGCSSWRCYMAIDEHDLGVGAATMVVHPGVAQLGFATSKEHARGRGVHMALLRRRIVDAAAAGCRMLFADVEEPLEEAEGASPAAHNLLRAGFSQESARTVWRPPEDLHAGIDWEVERALLGRLLLYRR